MPEFASLIQDMRMYNFTFLLGGGASLSSGVTSPEALAQGWFDTLARYMLAAQADITDDNRWVSELLRNPPQKYELTDAQVAMAMKNRNSDEWFRLISFIIDGIASSYFKIATMLEDVHNNGRDIIRRSVASIGSNAAPSIGYFLLAYLMAQEHVLDDSKIIHDTVITTNFDRMLAEAFNFQRIIDQNFRTARTDLLQITISDSVEQIEEINRWSVIRHRPLIYHVHNSADFDPRNTIRDVSYYASKVNKTLKKLIDNRMLLVMGYSGSDEGLMLALYEAVKRHPHSRVYWLCYKNNIPNSRHFRRLRKLLRDNLVILNCPNPNDIYGCPQNVEEGFDSFMWKLVSELYPNCPLLELPIGVAFGRERRELKKAQESVKVIKKRVSEETRVEPQNYLLTYDDSL